jgi:hypothetical protein
MDIFLIMILIIVKDKMGHIIIDQIKVFCFMEKKKKIILFFILGKKKKRLGFVDREDLK